MISSLAFDSHIIAGALGLGGSRTPVECLLVTWRQRLVPSVLYHVEIVGQAAPFILHRIDDTHLCRDAGAAQAARISHSKAFLIAGRHHDFKTEWHGGPPID